MKWVKLNYDRFLLAVFALALLACAGVLVTNAMGFSSVFASLKEAQQVAKQSTLGVQVDENEIARQQAKLTDPDQWQARIIERRRLALFVSSPYIARFNPDGTQTLIDPLTDDPKAALHPPVPNLWLLDHSQDLLANNVLEQDTDNDGFNTLDEFYGNTDPNDKNSHPPYYSKLFLKRFVRIPFRLRFDSKNGDSFFINQVDVEDAPTLIKKMNDVIKGNSPKTTFKITGYKEKYDTSQGFRKDVSELTLTNIVTNQVVVLPKTVEVDSPTTYAVLAYVWAGPGAVPEFAVQKDGEFSLKPEDKVTYKVLDLSDQDVKIVREDDKKEIHVRIQGPPGSPTTTQ